jgi:signal transduction histidine kinase
MQKEKQDIILAIVMGSLFVLLFGFITFLVIINYIRRKKKLLLEKQMQESHYQQAFLKAQLEMQEHTFKAISQEIHDNVGQILSLAKLNLNILSFEQKDNPTFDTVKELVTNAILELRNLGTGYYADRLVEEGLIVAIQHQLTQLNKTGLFTTSFKSELEVVTVDKSKTIFLYRMVQEALNNVVKHSGADRVQVNIFKKDDEVHIRIRDNGKGFESRGSDFKAGIGLSSIQQRASMIDAKAYINSKPGAGTLVNFVFK